MRKYLLMLCFLPLFLFANQVDVITVTEKDPNFTIAIPGNPTTGYLWLLNKYNSHLIQSVSYHYQENANKKLIGAPGVFRFSFAVQSAAFKVPHSTEIRFVYARPWMKGYAQVKRYSVRIMP